MRISHTRILARRALATAPTSVIIPKPLGQSTRPFFSLFRRDPKPKSSNTFKAPVQPQLLPTDLFHPLSQSPFPALVEKAERIKAASLCPVSYERYGERVRPAFDCPDCGFPTHRDEQRWKEGRAEHSEFCGRLREVNEDEHDLRSGRELHEFSNMPAEQSYEAAVSFTDWDNFFFTRDFPSIDSDRAVRHISKVLTYPITIAGVLHQNGPYTYGNGRITSEGRRSMAAIHSILHLPPGSSSDTAPEKPQVPFRIIVIGARAEASLPPALWEQLTFLYPKTNFNIYFIGPEVGLPLLDKNSPRRKAGYEFGDSEFGAPSYTLNVSPRLQLISIKANYETIHDQLGPFDPYSDVFFAFSPGLGFPHQGPLPEDTSSEPITLDRAEEVPASEVSSTAEAAANAYSLPEAETTPPIDVTGAVPDEMPSQPRVQAETSWRVALKQIFKTKCLICFTAFSPTDLERDTAALFGTMPPSGGAESPSYINLPTRPVDRIPGVTGEFELVMTPGANSFSSLRWEVAEWDPRVAVRTNYSVWAVRGKRYEVVSGESD